ncbi:MAG: ClbS/DfsB family four-helix bundle protein [Chloroflexota bacterium]|nr:ClbS/DfsB family four-helix bundle protein [Chloroflexota bacterium]MDE3193915.1 ClbS/DfsB family four-helix bundle protein [Chloroflexota bacterium]
MTAAKRRLTKDEVIAPIEREKDRLLALVQGMGEERASRAVVGEWSARDVVAHCVYWQGMLARMMGAPLPPPSWIPRWQSEHEVGGETINRLTVEHYRRMPFSTVLADFAFTADVVCKIVREMKEENLLLEAGAPWDPGTPVWQAIASESSGHCQEHSDELEKALAAKPA